MIERRLAMSAPTTLENDPAGNFRQSNGNTALLIAIREAFVRRDFEGALAAYQQLSATGKMPRNVRIEATCLAARAMSARKERQAARALLKPLLGEDYSKPMHYDFLAHALLDLRNYREVARVCARAAALIDEQKQDQPRTN